jgi:hypothetical protein
MMPNATARAAAVIVSTAGTTTKREKKSFPITKNGGAMTTFFYLGRERNSCEIVRNLLQTENRPALAQIKSNFF